jgi:hypothetical protein
VQSSHVTALIAAALPGVPWVCTTFVLHRIDPRPLAALIRECGGSPFTSASSGGVFWFTEPDLLWEPTAVASVNPTAGLAGLPLLGNTATVTSAGRCADRRWLARLAADTSRAGIAGEHLWCEAARFGDPADRAVRVRTAHLMVRGKEPPRH